MDLKSLVVVALQVSIVCTGLGYGLGATSEDLLYVVRRRGLLVRSLLAMFVVMPVVAIGLGGVFDFRQDVRVVLIALSISPVPPLLPGRQSRAGGLASYGLGLMATCALLSIVIVPGAVEILERFVGRPLTITPGAIAALALQTVLLPLAAGMAVRAGLPRVAQRIRRWVTLFAKLLLVVATLALLTRALPAVWALVGDGTVLGMAVFVAAGLAVGHLLGRPDRDHSSVLALSSACRHPVMALTIAAANFPDKEFGGTVILYLIVSAVVCLPYVIWQGRSTAERS